MSSAPATTEKTTTIRILIVDDHRLYREGLRMQLESESDFAVVGEAGDAEQGLSLALELQPAIVLMDIAMPGVSCFESMRRIHESLPNTRVIVLSGHKHDEQIGQALQAKAWGYAIKEEGFVQVRGAIRDVMAGKLSYAPQVLDRIRTEEGELRLEGPSDTLLNSLTPRERELLVLLGQGYSLKEAGQALHVSYKTVDKHKANLMKKLNIHDRVELARYAIREKLVEP